jgi:hypothetical protein
MSSVAAMAIFMANLNVSAVVMPNLDKATKDQQVSYWVGIDGKDADGNQKQIVVQAGFDATKKEDGSTSIEAWWEWFPNPLTMIPAKDFSASPGDSKCCDHATIQNFEL